jgi:hypothetical protein
VIAKWEVWTVAGLGCDLAQQQSQQGLQQSGIGTQVTARPRSKTVDCVLLFTAYRAQHTLSCRYRPLCTPAAAAAPAAVVSALL